VARDGQLPGRGTPRRCISACEVVPGRAGVVHRHSRACQTCAKVGRRHQRLKGFQSEQDPAGSIDEFQRQVHGIVEYDIERRPDRARGGSPRRPRSLPETRPYLAWTGWIRSTGSATTRSMPMARSASGPGTGCATSEKADPGGAPGLAVSGTSRDITTVGYRQDPADLD
jgi:hypothetical protein